MLKLGESDFDHMLLFLTMIKLSNQEETMKNFMNLAEFSRNRMDKYDMKEGTEELIIDYVFDVLEGNFTDNYLSYHPKFKAYIDQYYSKETERKARIEEFFGRTFPRNNCGYHTDTFNLKVSDEYFEMFLQSGIRKQADSVINVHNKFELDLKEPKTLKKLKNDFEVTTSKINDFSVHVV